ncbi:hypothetical protein Q7C36_002332 [Tachysurus vachellii]|uniref:USP domain-containing protein n=1 Tax=Tachysurus vachellii TaxID=175792 RepID=A0AA88NUB0_TACVA|nr:hypothetical protein Q7C36_002332 [Tachysurus vachellii]
MAIVVKSSEKSDFESALCKHSSSLNPVSSGGLDNGSSSWSINYSTAELSRSMTTCVALIVKVAYYDGNTTLPAERPKEQGKYFSGRELWRWHQSAAKDPVSTRAPQLDMDSSPSYWSRSPEPGQHMFSEFSSSIGQANAGYYSDPSDIWRIFEVQRIPQLFSLLLSSLLRLNSSIGRMPTSAARNCKETVQASKRLSIHRNSNVLTVSLKRFDDFNGGKISKDVRYTEYFDLRPYMSQSHGEPQIYGLYAVLVHSGFSCYAGHYYCYVKASNGQWYQMNDSSVTPTNIQTVLNQQAYLLFYIKQGSTDLKNGDFNQKGFTPGHSSPRPVTPKLNGHSYTSSTIIGPQLPPTMLKNNSYVNDNGSSKEYHNSSKPSSSDISSVSKATSNVSYSSTPSSASHQPVHPTGMKSIKMRFTLSNGKVVRCRILDNGTPKPSGVAKAASGNDGMHSPHFNSSSSHSPKTNGSNIFSESHMGTNGSGHDQVNGFKHSDKYNGERSRNRAKPSSPCTTSPLPRHGTRKRSLSGEDSMSEECRAKKYKKSKEKNKDKHNSSESDMSVKNQDSSSSQQNKKKKKKRRHESEDRPHREGRSSDKHDWKGRNDEERKSRKHQRSSDKDSSPHRSKLPCMKDIRQWFLRYAT